MANITQGENNTVYHWKEHLTTNVFLLKPNHISFFDPRAVSFLFLYYFLFI